ncbi:hypothetical protein ABIC94_001326 [Variovorax paradoxus]|uniref:hypothetical protein n=1 Tax=Variovorax paradoxus TaxID=34073 RepID=UPI0033942552
MDDKIGHLLPFAASLFPNLPRPAFLPRRILSDKERYDFVMRRDRLFALCTPSEQRRIMTLAHWFDAHDPLLMAKPNLFTRAGGVVALDRVLPWMRMLPGHQRRAPSLVERGLATVANGIDMLEKWRGQRALRGFIAELEALQVQGEADVLFGVVHFLRMVPVQVGLDAQREPLKQELERLVAACMGDASVPAVQRFAAIQRCALWSRDVTGWTHDVRDLDLHTWRQLLALLQEDAAAAVHVVDEHWDRRTSPQLFSKLSLHEDPQLAYRLAVALRPHRPDVAAALLGDSIFYASFQREKLRGDEAALMALEKVMDGSCALLAEWVLTEGVLGVDSAMAALQKLFQFGDPAQSYWRCLPHRAMALLRSLLPAGQSHPVPTLACVALYSPVGDPLGAMALELLEDTVRRLTEDAPKAPLEALSRLTDFFQFTLSRLEDKVLSGRNRRVPTQPDHGLLHIVDRVVDDLMARVAVEMPEQVLTKRMLLAHGLANETLIRKHHRLLRAEFEGLARAYPQNAGRMMKRLIKYCAYSQVDDEMYKRDLCSESFYLLLPILDAISPPDAAVAREGIGWNLREQGYDRDE